MCYGTAIEVSRGSTIAWSTCSRFVASRVLVICATHPHVLHLLFDVVALSVTKADEHSVLVDACMLRIAAAPPPSPWLAGSFEFIGMCDLSVALIKLGVAGHFNYTVLVATAIIITISYTIAIQSLLRCHYVLVISAAWGPLSLRVLSQHSNSSYS